MKEKKYYGKEKCRILKQIRAEIAKQNDIAWVVDECTHKGNCKGTCPKCEAEVRQLERALERRAALGKTVAVVGISAGLSLSVVGCANPFENVGGKPLPDDHTSPANGNAQTSVVDQTQSVEFDGVEIPGDDTVAVTDAELMGEPMIEGGMPLPVPGEEVDVMETEDETICELPSDTENSDWGDIAGELVEYDYMDGVLIMTVAQTLPSCVAIEENCFYGTDKDGCFWRIYCADTSGIEEGSTYKVQIGDVTYLDYFDEYPEGGWTPQCETTAITIDEVH